MIFTLLLKSSVYIRYIADCLNWKLGVGYEMWCKFKPNGTMCCKLLGRTRASRYRKLRNCTDEKHVCIKNIFFYFIRSLHACQQ